jgi:hypothetical protein
MMITIKYRQDVGQLKNRCQSRFPLRRAPTGCKSLEVPLVEIDDLAIGLPRR